MRTNWSIVVGQASSICSIKITRCLRLNIQRIWLYTMRSHYLSISAASRLLIKSATTHIIHTYALFFPLPNTYIIFRRLVISHRLIMCGLMGRMMSIYIECSDMQQAVEWRLSICTFREPASTLFNSLPPRLRVTRAVKFVDNKQKE